ncbi:conserved unknown protein [Ectocarpus siliculosus]|uniref:Presenilin n=1 Tax=Ectocarpus siliculosus TaxID=2880 RepID=D8LTV7_ECTSI|nr:conserved unknown protein [Ectocarpus siliculosus]|eukprot:CBN74004.1 conserved unknown protein [Ectocarpus siliculosus]
MASTAEPIEDSDAGVGAAEEARAPLLEEGHGTLQPPHRRRTAQQGNPDENGQDDGALDQADVAYSANSFMAVVKPVTLCMTLSAFITVSLYSDAEGATNSALSVYEVYDESTTTLDPSSVRLGKSFVNALIIVLVLAAATFVIVWMYWMRCMRCLVGYMAMSSAVLLGVMGGAVWAAALEVYQLPCDAFTYYGVLWNFAVVGVVAIFYQKGIPTVVTQAYLVATSIIMAWQLSRFEEWTGWCLLVVLALYDLCAVLTPCGPLKALVNLMQEYEEPMPGLLYEAELPAGPPRRRRPENDRRAPSQQQARREQPGATGGPQEGDVSSSPRAPVGTATMGGGGLADLAGGGDEEGGRGADDETPAAPVSAEAAAVVEPQSSSPGGDHSSARRPGADSAGASESVAAPLLELVESGTAAVAVGDASADGSGTRSGREQGKRRLATVRRGIRGGGCLDPEPPGWRTVQAEKKLELFSPVPTSSRAAAAAENDEDEEEMGVSIKLGLGDFVFYSVLVSKAALYGFTAWAACVVVIVFGLGATLVLLAVYRMALPALPISIGFGTVFYLLTRFSIQPYVEALNETPLYF